jgi:hypothetical protein
VDPHRPVGAEGHGQQVDHAIQRLPRIGAELLDDLEVEEDVAAGGVPADPHDAYAVQRVAGGHDRVGHRALEHLQKDVVDGCAVALLDDLDRLDVPAGLTDRGRHAAQRPRDVGQLHSQQERHHSTLGDPGDAEVSGGSGTGRTGQPLPEPGSAQGPALDRGAYVVR